MSSGNGPLNHHSEQLLRVGTLRDPGNRLDLRYGVYYAGKDEPKRYVLFSNGRTEWIEKYHYLFKDLKLPSDTALLTWDHRGQGASGGARAWVDHYDSYATDVAAIVERVTGGKPYAAICHSMGGLIVLYATLTGHLDPSAMVLSSPLLGLPRVPIPHVLAKPVAKLFTLCALGTLTTGSGNFTASKFASNNLTHCVDHYEAMLKTPYPVPAATFGWVAATFAATARVFEPDLLRRLTAPTLVMGGTKESVVDTAAFRKWVEVSSEYAKAPVQLRMIPGGRHELFSEIPEYYDQAVGVARDWLKDFLS